MFSVLGQRVSASVLRANLPTRCTRPYALRNSENYYHRSTHLDEGGGKTMRANKAVAKLLKISRRDAEKFLIRKRVQKNGKTISNLATSINLASDKVAVDGKILNAFQRQ